MQTLCNKVKRKIHQTDIRNKPKAQHLSKHY